MIKINKILMLLISLALLLLTSCGGVKKASKEATKQAIGNVEIIIPCSGSKYETDNNYFRATQSGTSTDLSMSREKAMVATKRRLSGYINSVIKSVTDRYAQDRQISKDSEFSEKFENLTREVVNQRLLEVKKICEKVSQKPDGKYYTFISLEVNKELIYNGIENKISNDKKLRQDYDKQKFEETFNREMEILKNQQN